MKTMHKLAGLGAAAHLSAAKPRPPGAGAAGAAADGVRFGRILVPLDFSDPTRKALKYAARFAEQFGSRIILLHVLEPAMSPDFTSFPLVMDEEKVMENARHRLQSLAKTFLHERCLDGTVVRTGSPFHEIAEAAHELGCDLIIIATHGFTGVKRALLGSTAERVVRHAPCPVLTVR
jgi:nucleotide-binding universal stress UspA family protein